MLKRPVLPCFAGIAMTAAFTFSSIAFSDEPQAAGEADNISNRSIARLRGYVRDPNGDPIAGATVRVAIPKRDMRFSAEDAPRSTIDQLKSWIKAKQELESKSDDSGQYLLEIPNLSRPTEASIDVSVPGYERLSGTLMRGGDNRVVKLIPKGIARENLELKPALYFRGTIVDEDDMPIENVKVNANFRIGRGSGGIERTTTNSDGIFEIFNYPTEAGEEFIGGLYFSHPKFLRHSVNNVYKIDETKRESIRIVLDRGRNASGIVLDPQGNPVKNVMVKVTDNRGNRKAALTDSTGKFALFGLPKGKAKLSVMDFVGNQKTELALGEKGETLDITVQLNEIKLPKEIPTTQVLGMQLTDITPKLKEAYGLWADGGALIMDPGKSWKRLAVGTLKPGFYFWMVGNQGVSSVRDFVARLIDETKIQDGPTYRVRIVYTFTKVEFDGTNTQYMVLTKEDVNHLETVLKELSVDASAKD